MRPLSAAQKLALAVMRGEAEYPPPRQANRSTRFMPRVTPRPRDLAVRSKTGTRIGPR